MKKHIAAHTKRRSLPIKAEEFRALTPKEAFGRLIDFLFCDGPNPKDIRY